MIARGRGLAAAVAIATAAAGCGLGPGEPSSGAATLTVTRDYGSERLAEATKHDPLASETVLRLLDRTVEIETRYGGGFVQSIEGVSGKLRGGRSFDWFFFVDGIESSEGAAQRRVLGGHRIWWDYRDWTDAMRVPAVVGSWPEPFAQAWAAEARRPVRVACVGDAEPCVEAQERLDSAGAEATVELSGDREGFGGAPVTAMLVGTWGEIERHSEAKLLDEGPAASGVFARFEDMADGPVLVALDERARRARELGPGAGLVAAVRDGERPPTWLVTGVDEAGVEAAVELLDSEDLGDRYAVATWRGESIALPIVEAGRG